jgi:hypothetical protein
MLYTLQHRSKIAEILADPKVAPPTPALKVMIDFTKNLDIQSILDQSNTQYANGKV